jgi:hypothetical protein
MKQQQRRMAVGVCVLLSNHIDNGPCQVARQTAVAPSPSLNPPAYERSPPPRHTRLSTAARPPAALVVQAQRLQLHPAAVGQQQQRAIPAVLWQAGVKGAQRLAGAVQGGAGGQPRRHARVVNCVRTGRGRGQGVGMWG